jgi:hypothetical protein
VNGGPSGNNLSVDNQINGLNVAGTKKRDSAQSGTQAGIRFLRRAAEDDPGDSDTGSSLLDDLDLHGEDQSTSDRRMRAEAKSIRKVIISALLADPISHGFHALQIEDLEITNRSLMVINASLEAAKHRQAKEIANLRRKLRESHLILPPKAYRLVTLGQAGDTSLDADNDDEDEDDDADEIDTLNMDNINDEGFKRCRNLLEALLGDGRRALAAKPEDFDVVPRGATKVLHAEELRSEVDPDERDRHDDDADTSITSIDRDSEEEVEGMVSIRITTPMLPSP